MTPDSTFTFGSEMFYVDKLLVRRKRKLSEIEFKILNSDAKQLYQISQKLGLIFECDFINMSNENVLNLYRRNYKQTSSCKTAITSKGVLIGYISKEIDWLNVKYIVTNEFGEDIFIIDGPKLFKSSYKIFTPDKSTLVGKITDKNKISQEQYEISFNYQLDVKTKFLILAANIVISDYRARKRRDD